MRNKHPLIAILILFLFGCESGFDKSLISDTKKLISTSGEHTLYRYYVESPMSFGSGFTVVNILKSDKECDYTDRDILRFHNSYPFWIKWKDNTTLSVKCLMSDSGLAKHQPIKTEVIKWKDWTFEVEYYSMFSSGVGGSFLFDKYSINGNNIKFKSKSDSLVFNRDEVQFALDSNRISAKQFEIDTFDGKLGLSFREYKLISNKSYNHKILQMEQPFIKTKL